MNSLVGQTFEALLADLSYGRLRVRSICGSQASQIALQLAEFRSHRFRQVSNQQRLFE